MAVLYNGSCSMYYTRPSDGKTYCFVPVPLLGESTEVLRTTGGDRLGVIHRLTFNGTLLPTMPSLSGVPDESTCISLLDRKREQLKSALSEDRGDLLVVDISGYPIVAAKPLIVSLDFDEGILVQQSPYSVVFEYEEPLGSGYVREYSDNWSFQQQDNDTVVVAHSVNAVGLQNTNNNTTAAQNAKDFVIARLGLDTSNAYAIRTPIVQSLVAIDNLTGFNKAIAENYSESEGSYGVEESYILASGGFLDDRTIEESFVRDEAGALVRTVSVNGTVLGYGDTTFDRFANAQTGFNTFVSPQIDYDNDSGLESKAKTLNRIAGTVQYSLVRVPSSGGINDLQNRAITRQFERQEDGSVNQTVTTTASVRQSSISGIEAAIAYCFENNYPIDSAYPIFSASLSGNVISISTSRDELNQSFSLTRVFTDQTTPLWREEFALERQENADTSVVTVSINGTVVGLGHETTTKGTARFASASGAYFGTVEGLARSRVLAITPTGYCITDTPISQTLGYNQLQGIITYSKTYDSRFKTPNLNVLSEDIEVGFQYPADVIAVIPIPGKASGPILQDQETVTGKQKTLGINYKMKRQLSSCSGDTSVVPSNQALAIALAESDILVTNTPSIHSRGEKPESTKVHKIQDTVNFNRQSYEFTRSITWQYL